jgi:uncharacterized membrane protein
MDTRQERERGLGRLVGFSDAVVAIAATLLVLPLVDEAANIGDRSLTELLSDNGHAIFAFALSFAVILRFWLVHHSMYEHVIDYSLWLMFTNSIWLFCIVALPFPTELIGRSAGQGSVGNGLYIGTMLLASAAGLAGQWILLHTPNLVNESAIDQLTLEPGVSTTITMAVAFVIAVLFPVIGLWALLLLVVSSEFDRQYVRRRRKRIAQSSNAART